MRLSIKNMGLKRIVGPFPIHRPLKSEITLTLFAATKAFLSFLERQYQKNKAQGNAAAMVEKSIQLMF